MVLRTNDDNKERIAICNRFAEDAHAAGIGITCRSEPFKTLVTRLVSSYDWELVLIGQKMDTDPVVFADLFLSSGSRYLIHPSQTYPGRSWEAEADAAWRDAVFTLDEARKKSALEKIQRTWIRESPWVYTFASAVVHACKAKWENLFPRSAPGYGLRAILPRIYEREQQ